MNWITETMQLGTHLEIVIDVRRHAVYALATGIGYALLDALGRDCGLASSNRS